MAALALPASPALATTNSANVAPSSSDTDGTDRVAFSAVLTDKITNQAALAAQVLDLPIVDMAADTATANAELLPILLGLAAPALSETLQQQGQADDANSPQDIASLLQSVAADAAAAIKATEGTAPVAAPIIAATPLATPVANDPVLATSLTDQAQGFDGGQKGGPSTAILAAITDNAASKGPQALVKTDESFASALTEANTSRNDTMSQMTAATAPRSPEHTVRIEAPVGTQQWNGEFANKVAWVASRSEQRADLVLNPPHLGRVEVSLSVSGDQATAIFTSASSTVRDAIENALPRLREVLAESGINLGQTNVGSQSPQQSSGQGENRDNRGHAANSSSDDKLIPPGFARNSPTAWQHSGRGMVDVFA